MPKGSADLEGLRGSTGVRAYADRSKDDLDADDRVDPLRSFRALISIGPERHGVPTRISSAAALFALTSWFGVARLVRSKEESWRIYEVYFIKHHDEVPLPGPLCEKTLQWRVDTKNTRLSLLPDKVLPWIFILAWSFLLTWSATQ